MSHYNEVINEETEKLLGKTAKWKVCLNCGEPLEKKESSIRCINWYWHCPECNITIDKDLDQLYKCSRCGKIIGRYEELVFEFITPNWKEISFCYKPTGIKQYLCPKCHGRAIKPLRFKNLRNLFAYILLFFALVLRPKSKG